VIAFNTTQLVLPLLERNDETEFIRKVVIAFQAFFTDILILSNAIIFLKIFMNISKDQMIKNNTGRVGGNYAGNS
jgi:hypothetical protein